MLDAGGVEPFAHRREFGRVTYLHGERAQADRVLALARADALPYVRGQEVMVAAGCIEERPV